MLLRESVHQRRYIHCNLTLPHFENEGEANAYVLLGRIEMLALFEYAGSTCVIKKDAVEALACIVKTWYDFASIFEVG